MADLFSSLFLAMLAATTLLRAYLVRRQAAHVQAHREAVPAAFAAQITLSDHQKAADYTQAKLRLGLVELAVDAAWLLLLTFGGLLAHIDRPWREYFATAPYLHGLALFASVALASLVVNLPFSLYRTFAIEARFGFNKTTPALFLADLVKQLLLAALIGAPLLLAVLWLMAAMGERWWLWVWAVWLAFNLLVLALYPSFIAPLFNRFTPLGPGETKARIEALLARCGFPSAGVFVMDGSKRSAH
ncbi:MAG: M48 family peptidase, partial [Rhodocyclaceae bacterium]|nr:M48 family peptidase [Rhodocyclaceae bacterium]